LRTSKVTSHLLTNADIIQMFLPVEIQIIGDLDQPGLIQITP
jgi:RNA 3'-terminal phosphate cyclase